MPASTERNSTGGYHVPGRRRGLAFRDVALGETVVSAGRSLVCEVEPLDFGGDFGLEEYCFNLTVALNFGWMGGGEPWAKTRKSSGPTRLGTRSEVVPKSHRVAKIVMQKRGLSDFAG